MVDITISVSGHQQVSQRLSRLASQIGDLTPANRRLSIQLYEWVIKNYDSEGGSVGGWAELADSTKARKAKLGKEKKLVISGYGRASILPFSDANQAGIGTPVPYMQYHQEGRSWTTKPRKQKIYHKVRKDGSFSRGGAFVKKSQSNFERTVDVGAHGVELPQRRFLPNEEETLSMAIDVYGHYVERAVAEANS